MYAVATDQPVQPVADFIDALAVDLPVLLDPDGTLDEVYAIDPAFDTAAFPQIWLVDREGRFAYRNNRLETDEMIWWIESLLAE